MKALEQLFLVHRARSGLFTEYVAGDVAYVGNTIADNSVVGYVTPLAKDRIFQARAIVVSAFCDATIQAPPFVACGRAGNGLVVLEPRKPMTVGALARYAAYINTAVRWRFNWYRQVTADRLKRILLPDTEPSDNAYPVGAFLPATVKRHRPEWELRVQRFAIGQLFQLLPGKYHSLNTLSAGTVPVVSCGNEDNGVAGYFDVRKHLHANCLTIALNGSTLAAKYHPYQFAAKDDVAVCIPCRPLQVTTILFIQAVLEMERWRYSYYRKCYMNKLRRFTVTLPSKDDELDEGTMAAVVTGAPYWDYLSTRIASTPVTA
jgi:hypothetical protein